MSLKNNKFKNIIASGGGIKALGLIGALNALYKNDLLDDIETYIGCSASSIVLLFTLLGYDLKDVFLLVRKCTQNILDNENSIINLIQDGGIGKGIEYTNMIDNAIEEKIGKKHCTFAELYKITKKTFILCITNLNSGKIIYMSHKNYPNFIVSEAIRVSCGLPFLFTPSIYHKICISKTNNKTKKTKNKYYYICSDNDNYIGFYDNTIKSKTTTKIIITKNKEILKKILFVIKYINISETKSWIITSFCDCENRNIKFNDNLLNNKSATIKNNSILEFNSHPKINTKIYFQNEMTFADGAILDVFPIHLSKKMDGNTIGITYEYEKDNSIGDGKCTGTIVNNNILNYIIRIKEITIDNSYWTRITKYKSNYVVVDIPRHIGMCHFDINDNDINSIISNGFKKTSEYIKLRNKTTE